MTRLRLLVASLAARLLVWAESGLPSPLADEGADRLHERVMDAIAADHGEGMARRQLAARRMADRMATGECASHGGTTADHYSVKRRAND